MKMSRRFRKDSPIEALYDFIDMQLFSRDNGGDSDPYLVVGLGTKVCNDREKIMFEITKKDAKHYSTSAASANRARIRHIGQILRGTDLPETRVEHRHRWRQESY